jgi:hypothetical protein
MRASSDCCWQTARLVPAGTLLTLAGTLPLTYTVTPFFFHPPTSTPSHARLAPQSNLLYNLQLNFKFGRCGTCDARRLPVPTRFPLSTECGNSALIILISLPPSVSGAGEPSAWIGHPNSTLSGEAWLLICLCARSRLVLRCRICVGGGIYNGQFTYLRYVACTFSLFACGLRCPTRTGAAIPSCIFPLWLLSPPQSTILFGFMSSTTSEFY